MASDDHRGITPPLLADDDPPAVTIVNPSGSSPYVFIGDHAGNVIPRSLRNLGVEGEHLTRHIAWDIGVAGLGLALADMLDAVFVRQAYSRLVIDCNRAPGAADAVPVTSDGTVIPSNQGLTADQREERRLAIQEPYQRAIGDVLDRRDAEGRESVLISLHSFTPALAGGPARPWHVGVLHDGGDPRFATALLAELRRDAALTVGDNEPYRMDQIDYTVPRHAYPGSRPYAELEIRQDLLASEAGQQDWARRLAKHFGKSNGNC